MSVTYPLPNATVLIIRSDRTYAVVTKTDENGKVTITVPPGTYDIYVIKNYFTIHHQVEIVDQNIVKTIKLEKLYTREYINQYVAQLLGTVEGIYSVLQTIEYYYPEILKPWCIDALIREPEYGLQVFEYFASTYPLAFLGYSIAPQIFINLILLEDSMTSISSSVSIGQ